MTSCIIFLLLLCFVKNSVGVKTISVDPEDIAGYFKLKTSYGTYLQVTNRTLGCRFECGEAGVGHAESNSSQLGVWGIEPSIFDPSNRTVHLATDGVFWPIDRYLIAENDGSVDLAHEFKMDLNNYTYNPFFWTPMKHVNGSFSFNSSSGRWLRANIDGSVSTVEELDQSAHFSLEKQEQESNEQNNDKTSEGNHHKLKTSYGTFLQVTNITLGCIFKCGKADVGHAQSNSSLFEVWNIMPLISDLPNQSVRLETNGVWPRELFLIAKPDGSVALDVGIDWSNVTEGETPFFWIPIKHMNGSFSFKSSAGRWLSAHINGSVSTVDELDKGAYLILEKQSEQEMMELKQSKEIEEKRPYSGPQRNDHALHYFTEPSSIYLFTILCDLIVFFSAITFCWCCRRHRNRQHRRDIAVKKEEEPLTKFT